MATSSSTNVLKNKLACPCCSFLPNDLFLPSSEKGCYVKKGNLELQDGVDPLSSWELIAKIKSQDGCVLVDTHGHAHLEKDSQGCYNNIESSQNNAIISLTCAVEQSDWENCLQYASQSPHRMAALGVHPWYLADLSNTWLEDLETLLGQHEGCMVGEIGLCKMARFVRTYEHGKTAALELQRSVFTKQLKLAAKYQRPVSIHCVNQHGVLMDIFKELNPATELPPVLAMHSFTGTAHQIQQLLRWESELFHARDKRKKKKADYDKSTIPTEYKSPLLYFGFSHSINYAMCSSEKSKRQGLEAIRAVPRDRLLAESDVHSHQDLALGTAGAVAYIALALDEPVLTIANLTRQNGLRFLQRLSEATKNSSFDEPTQEVQNEEMNLP